MLFLRGQWLTRRIQQIVEKAGVDKPTKIAEIGKPERRMFIVTFASEREKWRLVAKVRSICISIDGLNGLLCKSLPHSN